MHSSEREGITKIIDLRPSAKEVNCVFIILEKGRVDRVPGQDTRICFVLVADSSAAVNLQLWGNEVEAFQAGDIIRLNAGYFTNFKNSLFLKAGKRGKLEKIGEFTMLFSEAPNMSRLKWSMDPSGKMNPVFNHEEGHGEQHATG